MKDDIVKRLNDLIRAGYEAHGVMNDARSEIDRLREENERLREAWMMEKQVGVRMFDKMFALQKALEKIAKHPTGGVGCNPVVFVKAARAALEWKGE